MEIKAPQQSLLKLLMVLQGAKVPFTYLHANRKASPPLQWFHVNYRISLHNRTTYIMAPDLYREPDSP